jgi:hypothetical protein
MIELDVIISALVVSSFGSTGGGGMFFLVNNFSQQVQLLSIQSA